ncbi:MAG: hypothetical protein AAGE94_15695 [Acidobacteriota bacterium]
MLAVDRSAQPVPAALVGDDSPASRELAKATAHYAVFDPDDPERSKSYSFRVYKHDTVKAAIEALFHRKCAYCESSFAATAPVDIEHYRPKAAIVIQQGGVTTTLKPGYWWLAADWHNLLPSCIDCNRKRGQDLPDDEHAKVGKANAFPLADEGARARAPGEETGEQRLLLDPCRDDPGILQFRFDKATEAALITAAESTSALERRMAETSIRILGLNRDGLRTSRAGRFTQIHSQARALVKATSRFEHEPMVASRRQDLADEIRDLLPFRRADREYTAMARQIIDPLLPVLRGVLTRLAADLLAGTDGDPIDRFVEHFPSAPLDLGGAAGAGAMADLLG